MAATKKKKDITKTEAWDMADWDYAGIIADDRMPLLSEPLRGQERIDTMKEILGGCPEYYPAMFDIGQTHIILGGDTEAKKWFDKCFKIIKEHFSKKDLIDAYGKMCEFLKPVFRYELALEYYKILSELETKKNRKADAYDGMAYCYVMLDSIDKAIEVQQKVLELDKSARSYSITGWQLMIKGDIEKAEDALKKAVKLDKKDEYAKNNLDICRLMKKQGIKTWNDYLLRKPDYDYLGELEDAEDEELLDKADEYVRHHNVCKLEAFKSGLLKNPGYTLAEKHDIYITIKYILKFIHDLNEDGWFLYDNASTVNLFFKEIMHKFIFKTGDIDDKIFNDVYTALLEFYKFLRKNGLVSGSEYKDLEKNMLGLKSELREKMLRYNEVRHNDDYSEEEKEEIRDELFEGDHELLFL